MAYQLIINDIPVKTNSPIALQHHNNVSVILFKDHLFEQLKKGVWSGCYQKHWWIVPLIFRD